MPVRKITYSQVGDNYDTKDPVKKLTQKSASETAVNLRKHGFREISETRGESAFVWEQNGTLMASVIEGLGTKNLIADKMEVKYYENIGHDTVATIINDLISVGATPLVIHAYWAIEDNSWLQEEERMKFFIKGWKDACDISNVTWGGGETPTLKGIIVPGTIDLGGSAVGFIKSKNRLITDRKLQIGDRILLLKSSGMNCNGLSLARAVVEMFPNDKNFIKSILTKTHIYSALLEKLFEEGVDIHYISNITGHGFRKIMRARQNYKYLIEEMFKPQDVFSYIQKKANLSDYEMYQTFNMGMDFAIFLPEKEIKKAQRIVKSVGFESIDAGVVQKGEKQVIIKPKNIVFKAETMDLR